MHHRLVGLIGSWLTHINCNMMAIINYTANQSESDCGRLEAVCLPLGNLCNLLVIESVRPEQLVTTATCSWSQKTTQFTKSFPSWFYFSTTEPFTSTNPSSRVITIALPPHIDGYSQPLSCWWDFVLSLTHVMRCSSNISSVESERKALTLTCLNCWWFLVCRIHTLPIETLFNL